MNRPGRRPDALHRKARQRADVHATAELSEGVLPADHPSKGALPIPSLSSLISEIGELLDCAGIVEPVERRLRSHRGTPSRLTVRAMLTAIMYVGGHLSSYLREDIAAWLAGLKSSDAEALGLTGPGTGREPISYNMVCDQFGRLEAALAHGWTDIDGTLWDAERFAETLVHASVPPEIAAKVLAVAVDETDYPTWAVSRRYIPEKDALAERAVADLDTELGGDETSDEQDEPASAERDAERNDGLIGTFGEDNRLIRSKDPDARIGRRSAIQKRKAGKFLGYGATVASAVAGADWHGDPDRVRLGDPIEPYILAVAVRPAGTHPGRVGLDVVESALRLAPGVSEVLADRAYTTKREQFNRPLHVRDIDVVKDFKSTDVRSPNVCMIGKRKDLVIEHCGTFLHPDTPEYFQAPPAGMAEEELPGWYSSRNRFVYTVNQYLPGGGKQMTCPVHAGKIAIEATQNTSPATVPLIPRKNGTTEMCCKGHVNVRPDELDRHQTIPYGTPAQTQSYGRRSVVEGFFGEAKTAGGFAANRCRVFKLAPHVIAAAATVVAFNLKLTRIRKWREQMASGITTDRHSAPNSEPGPATTEPGPDDADTDDSECAEPDFVPTPSRRVTPPGTQAVTPKRRPAKHRRKPPRAPP